MPQDNRMGNVKISKANTKRKNPKPILEKKRRARINESLSELKTLLVEVLQKEGCRHSSKMEKADVIEMAVRHLKNLQKQKNFPGTKAPSLRDSYPPAIPVEKYASSFSPDCLSLPIRKFIARSPTEFNSKAAVGAPHPRRSDTMVTSQRIANRDYNYNILSALLTSNTKTYALPTNSNVSGMTTATLPDSSKGIAQSMMTRAATGDIALDLSQHSLKQAAAIQHNAGSSPYERTQLRVDTNIPSIPLWSYQQKPVTMPTMQQLQGSAFTSLPSSSSTLSTSQSSLQSPVSPVWRPW